MLSQDPVVNAQLATIAVLFSTLLILVVARRATVATLFWSSALCATPLLILGTVQKMFYMGDVVALTCATRFFVDLPKLPKLAVSRFDIADTLAFFLLVFSPLLTCSLQIVFSESAEYQFMLLSVIRSAGAFFMFYALRSDLRSRVLRLEDLLIAGLVCWTLVATLAFLNYLGVMPSDALSVLGTTASITDWTEGYGGGVLGMYRGEYGAYMAILVALLAPLAFSRPGTLLIALTALALSAYCVLSVGSRQGAAAIALLLVFYLVSPLFFPGVARVASASSISIAVLIGALMTLLVFDSAFSVWVWERFDLVFADAGEVKQAVGERDGRVPDIVRELWRVPHMYFIGAGYGGTNDTVVPGDWRVTYVDSEVFWVLQQNGIIGLVAYASLFLVWVVASAKHARIRGRAEYSLASLTSVGCLLVAITFLYGHYVFLNWQTAHASVAYVHWISLAISLFLCERR